MNIEFIKSPEFIKQCEMAFNPSEAETASSPESIPLDERKRTEIGQLMDIAKHIGAYDWVYNKEGVGTDGLHSGSTAQEIQKVAGLSSAVKSDENGILRVDTPMVTLALLGYVATISRILLGVEKE